MYINILSIDTTIKLMQHFSPGYFLRSPKTVPPNFLLFSVFPKKCFTQECYRIQVHVSVCRCMYMYAYVCAFVCVPMRVCLTNYLFGPSVH